jgi:hypothetical protein
MKLSVSSAILAAICAATATVGELTAAQSTSAVPVTVTFADLTDHKIKSVGGSVYEHGKGVSATIDPSRNGELIFYSVKSGKIAQRRFALDFSACIAGPCDFLTTTPWQTGAQFIAGIRRPDGASLPGGMLAMPVSATGYRAGLKVYLGSTDNVEWTLCLTPGDAANVCSNRTSTGSTPTHIVRTTPDTWTISADTADVGELFTVTTSRRSEPLPARRGGYAMPFSMTVQCVNGANCPVP